MEAGRKGMGVLPGKIACLELFFEIAAILKNNQLNTGNLSPEF